MYICITYYHSKLEQLVANFSYCSKMDLSEKEFDAHIKNYKNQVT